MGLGAGSSSPVSSRKSSLAESGKEEEVSQSYA